MKIVESLIFNPKTKIFSIEDFDEDNIEETKIIPLNDEIINYEEGHFLVKAIQVKQDKSIVECYMDLSLPERINDYAFFIKDQKIIFDYPYKFEGEIICAVPSELFGGYELYYSKINPEIGIKILKDGISKSKNKSVIAEDLAYILRDENRVAEAIKYFQISINENPSTEFIFYEIIQLYEKINDQKMIDYYSLEKEKYLNKINN